MGWQTLQTPWRRRPEAAAAPKAKAKAGGALLKPLVIAVIAAALAAMTVREIPAIRRELKLWRM